MRRVITSDLGINAFEQRVREVKFQHPEKVAGFVASQVYQPDFNNLSKLIMLMRGIEDVIEADGDNVHDDGTMSP